MNLPKRAIFFDRDGIINKVVMRDDKPASPRVLKELVIQDYIKDVLSEFQQRGFLNLVVTNQPDINRKLMILEDLCKIHDHIKSRLPICDILLCPHDDSDACLCRKPKPGMLLQAAQKWNIDMDLSYIVGDSWRDMEAGKNAGCQTIFLRTHYNLDFDGIVNFEISHIRDVLNLFV